jgi:predicted ATP-dependent endonuclease of OLD family
MRIKTLKITNFRSIKDTCVINLGQINAFIGPNNAGKSNILNVIYRVLVRDWVTVNNFDEDDVYLKEHDRDIEIEIEFQEPYLYQAFKDTEPSPIPKIKFTYTRYKIGEYKGQRRLEKNCLSIHDGTIQVLAEKPKMGTPLKYRPLTTIPQEMQENIPVIFIGPDRSLKNQLPNARNSLLGTLLNDINNDFNREDNKIVIKQPDGREIEISRKDRFQQCINEAITSLRTEEFLKLEKSIKDNALHQLGFDPEKETDKLDIYFNPLSSLEFYKSLEIWIKEHGFSINAIDLGTGFQNALVISILKAFEERRKAGALFLIEEPEMYLHPQMQRSLYKTLRNIGAKNQILYVTHSPNFITIPEYDELRIVRKDKDGTKVKHSTLPQDPRLKEKFTKELDPERNELFFAQRILIVEGDTEKLALPEYSKRMGFDFDKVGSTIIEVGGKRNIIDFIELALSLDIPTAIAYDIDSSDFKDKRDEEIEFNKRLEGYKDKGVTIFRFDKNYEQELKKYWTEDKYQEYCRKFEKISKPVRARLFALDPDLTIPYFIKPIVNWTANVG